MENLYGTVNDAGGYAPFGLNVMEITKFEFSPNVGPNNTPGNGIVIEGNVGGKQFWRTFYEPDSNREIIVGNKSYQTTDLEYKEHYINQVNDMKKTVTHFVKAYGITQEQIDEALKVPPRSFREWAIIMTKLPPNPTTTLHIFLEYEWNIKPQNTRTFLQIPKNMKGGRWASPLMTGIWQGVQQPDGSLKYINENGQVHPISKSKDFMESPKANLQQKDSENPIVTNSMGQVISASDFIASVAPGTDVVKGW
jgi:hypothetical protein